MCKNLNRTANTHNIRQNTLNSIAVAIIITLANAIAKAVYLCCMEYLRFNISTRGIYTSYLSSNVVQKSIRADTVRCLPRSLKWFYNCDVLLFVFKYLGNMCCVLNVSLD